MAPGEPPVVPRSFKTIVIVDSEPQARKLAIFMLEREGYIVLEARNRQEAPALFDKHGPTVSLLLIEVTANLLQVAAKLKELYSALQVLYMSEFETSEAARAVVEQALPFLKKPFTMQEIVGKVRQLLDAPPTG